MSTGLDAGTVLDGKTGLVVGIKLTIETEFGGRTGLVVGT